MTIFALRNDVPEIDATAWVAPGAMVMGQVRLGAGASVWFGAVLRGDTEFIVIGAGTNLQEHVICHTDMGAPLTVGADCTIGHRATLHGCTIGNGTLIGMGATVLNHAVIGQNCLIGAGALVTEGKVIPDGSLVMGVPARVVRPLTEDQIAGLLRSAEGYRRNAGRFRAELRALDE
ncbi:MAG: gamma carbonic anhydrase family protein [Rhodobacteraceae bacterium]|nr:gamma carbonic anhydrase family protein [Paracoccaceae bacterium]